MAYLLSQPTLEHIATLLRTRPRFRMPGAKPHFRIPVSVVSAASSISESSLPSTSASASASTPTSTSTPTATPTPTPTPLPTLTISSTASSTTSTSPNNITTTTTTSNVSSTTSSSSLSSSPNSNPTFKNQAVDIITAHPSGTTLVSYSDIHAHLPKGIHEISIPSSALSTSSTSPMTTNREENTYVDKNTNTLSNTFSFNDKAHSRTLEESFEDPSNGVLVAATPTSNFVRSALGAIIKTSALPRHAAVLIPLCYDNSVPSVLFIRRARTMRHHRGQVAFPGGMFDPEDLFDPRTCALRETMEEIGLDPNLFTVLGLHHDASTSEIKSNQGTVVTPVIAMLKYDINDIKLSLQHAELDLVFCVPLQDLCNGDRWELYRSRPSFQFRVGDYTAVDRSKGVCLERRDKCIQNILSSKKKQDGIIELSAWNKLQELQKEFQTETASWMKDRDELQSLVQRFHKKYVNVINGLSKDISYETMIRSQGEKDREREREGDVQVQSQSQAQLQPQAQDSKSSINNIKDPLISKNISDLYDLHTEFTYPDLLKIAKEVTTTTDTHTNTDTDRDAQSQNLEKEREKEKKREKDNTNPTLKNDISTKTSTIYQQFCNACVLPSIEKVISSQTHDPVLHEFLQYDVEHKVDHIPFYLTSSGLTSNPDLQKILNPLLHDTEIGKLSEKATQEEDEISLRSLPKSGTGKSNVKGNVNVNVNPNANVNVNPNANTNANPNANTNANGNNTIGNNGENKTNTTPTSHSMFTYPESDNPTYYHVTVQIWGLTAWMLHIFLKQIIAGNTLQTDFNIKKNKTASGAIEDPSTPLTSSVPLQVSDEGAGGGSGSDKGTTKTDEVGKSKLLSKI